MLTPDKYTSVSGSVLGQGAILLKFSRPNQTLTELWHDVKKDGVGINYERLILVLDLLFALGAVRTRRGVLVWNHHEA